MKNKLLDAIDLQILNLLQKNGRISIKELAAQVYLSSPAVSSRIEQLEKEVFLIKKDRLALTNEFQIQFSKIEQLLGCLADAIEQLRLRP